MQLVLLLADQNWSTEYRVNVGVYTSSTGALDQWEEEVFMPRAGGTEWVWKGAVPEQKPGRRQWN